MTAPPSEREIQGASCLAYRDAPAWDQRRTACVGRFVAESATAGRALLDAVAAELAAEGFTGLIGPMDGDTWHAYRLITDTDGTPPFLMEPVSGPHDADAFAAAGFAPISRYVSTRTTLAAAIGPEPVSVEGVTVTAWDGSDPTGFVRRLYALSAGAFRANAFFKPLDIDGFLALYAPVMPLVDPRFVLFAHDEAGALAGFLFGVPNRLEGPAARTVILKTYASLRRGVGHVLADRFHRAARDAGFVDVIHALMHESNASLERSGRHGATIFRRYALMGRELAP
jgi:hypothetical protein